MAQTGSSGTHHRIRSGDEPTHARSPLRLRLTLALIGLANGVAGAILFVLLGSRPLTWAFAVLAAIIANADSPILHEDPNRPRRGPR